MAGRNDKFRADIRAFIKKAEGNIDLCLRKILFDMSYKIVTRTPVDTGRLRANWQFGVDTIPDGALESTDPSGYGTIAGLRSAMGEIHAGHVHYFVNNLPYASVVEYGLYPNPAKKGTKTAGGFSLQAPAGMVRITAVEFSADAKKAVQEIQG